MHCGIRCVLVYATDVAPPSPAISLRLGQIRSHQVAVEKAWLFNALLFLEFQRLVVSIPTRIPLSSPEHTRTKKTKFPCEKSKLASSDRLVWGGGAHGAPMLQNKEV